MIDVILKRHIDVIRASYDVALSVINYIDDLKGHVIEGIVSSAMTHQLGNATSKIEGFLEDFHFKTVETERMVSTILQHSLAEVRERETQFLLENFPGFREPQLSPVSGAFINGVHYAEWIPSIFVPLRRDVVGAYRLGITNNHSPLDIVKKMSGDPKMGHKDSLFQRTKNKIFSLARTLVLQTANDERISFYKRNPNRFNSIAWVNPFGNGADTVDGTRTGDYYSIPDLNGSNKSYVWSGSLVHFNSRSTQVPIYSDEVIVKEQLERWFGTRDELYQKEVLGNKKHNLWRSGKLTKTQTFDLTRTRIPVTAL